jgi:hypothetical protein
VIGLVGDQPAVVWQFWHRVWLPWREPWQSTQCVPLTLAYESPAWHLEQGVVACLPESTKTRECLNVEGLKADVVWHVAQALSPPWCTP